jgi:hypothetical protein
VQARDIKSNYLGMLQNLEDVGCFGYITNTKTVFMIMTTVSEKTVKDSLIIKLFNGIHDAYVKMCMNIFYDYNSVTSEFIQEIDKISKEDLRK